MKILMFLASAGQGGLENTVVNLCNGLVDRHDVAVMAYNHSQWLHELDKKVELLTLRNGKSRYNPWLYFNILDFIKEYDPDVIHSHGGKAAEIINRLKWFYKAPHVATKHNVRKGKIFNELEHVIAVSPEVAKSISHDVTVVFNGIVPIKKTSRFQLSEDLFNLLAVGRLDPVKGFDVLIQAMHHLPAHVLLWLVGEGPEKQRLQKLVVDTGLQKRVKFLGHRDDVPELMAKAHAVVVSSNSEGFGLVLVESLFYANLLLSTRVGVAESILAKKLLLDHEKLAEQLKAVVNNYDIFRQQFLSCQNENKDKFSMTEMIKGYESYYHKLIGNNQ